MESFDYLNELRLSNKYQVALLTTYNFDINFFESFILNSLINNGIKKVSVYADSEQLKASLKNIKNSYIGKRYVVNPISIKGAFHPKLVLLLGENSAKLFVSSANLTTSGFCMNNEVVNEFVFDKDHPENLKIISQAISFFEKIDSLSYGLDSEIFQDILNLPYYGKHNTNQSLYLLHNIDEPIIDQLHAVVQTADEIDIAVPYYDSALSVIEEMKFRYPQASINVWIQNNKSKFPVWREGDRRFHICKYKNISWKNDGKNIVKSNFYHGKVFRIKSGDKSYIAYGSANCTKSAMLLSNKDGGNVECDILEVGAREEFNGFFEGFIEDAEPLTCEKLNDFTAEQSNISFLYGKMSNTKVELVFNSYKRFQNLCAYIGDDSLTIINDNNRIVLNVDPERLSGLSEVFAIIFLSTDFGEETVNCWVVDIDYLNLFRISEESGGIYSFNIDSTDDKYIRDRYELLSAYSLSRESIIREEEVERYFQPKVSDPELDIDDDDDGIIDYIPPSIDIFQEYKRLNHIRHIETVYRNSFSKWISSAPKTIIDKNNGEYAAIETPIHISVDQDKSFVRFVKAQYKKLLNPDYLEKVDPERFFAIVLIFFEIFDKYTVFSEKKLNEMIIPPTFATEAKSFLLLSLSKLNISDETRKLLDELKILTIVVNHILDQQQNDSRINKTNRELLNSIYQDEEFRKQGYIEYVLQAVKAVETRNVKVELMSEVMYVDSLFGYRPLSSIRNIIQEEYGKNSVINIEQGKLSVEAAVDNIGEYMTIPKGSLREINNYAKMQKCIGSLFVDVVLRGAKKGPNPAIRITYDASNLPSQLVRQTIYRRDGKREESNQLIS